MRLESEVIGAVSAGPREDASCGDAGARSLARGSRDERRAGRSTRDRQSCQPRSLPSRRRPRDAKGAMQTVKLEGQRSTATREFAVPRGPRAARAHGWSIGQEVARSLCRAAPEHHLDGLRSRCGTALHALAHPAWHPAMRDGGSWAPSPPPASATHPVRWILRACASRRSPAARPAGDQPCPPKIGRAHV